MVSKKAWFFPLLILFSAFLVWFFHLKLLYPPYLTFSDAAKFADAAREIVAGRGFTARFGFFHPNFVFTPEVNQPIVPGFGILNALTIVLFFKFLGVNDLAVVFTSGFFFIVNALLVYLIAQRLFDKKVALFSSLAFIFTQPLLDYASIGAGEPLFIFLFLFSCWFFILEKKYSLCVSAAVASLLFLSRPQAPIYLFGLAVFIFFGWQKDKAKRLSAWIGVFAISLIFLFVLSKASSQKLIHLELVSSLFFERATAAQNITIRGKPNITYPGFFSSLKPLATKLFYNLYNFYKSLPTLVSVYLVSLYLLSLFRWERKRKANALQLAGLIILVLSFFAASLTIPFMRYVHPITPVIIIFAVEMLVWILGKFFKKDWKVWMAGLFLIFFFVVGQTSGKIFLDSRYLGAHTNQDKPPVYVKLAEILKENTQPDDLIITNLDTWGTWYGERKTVWYPHQPSQLIPPKGKDLAVSAIFLTSYKMGDESYYMGEDWQEIFYQPGELKDLFLAENFGLAGNFEIKSEETYEREGARAILLKRKEQ